jgi:TolA-binding protein
VGPEYLAIGLTAIVSAATGGSWAINKLLDRQHQRLKQTLDYVTSQKRRIDTLEDQINRMPLDYVLKVDFLREIQEMHDNFRQINNKLDKLMEKILSK